MKLRQIVDMCCKGLNCPAVFEDMETGAILVQGRRLSSVNRSTIALGDDEEVVEVPRDLMDKLVQELRTQARP